MRQDPGRAQSAAAAARQADGEAGMALPPVLAACLYDSMGRRVNCCVEGCHESCTPHSRAQMLGLAKVTCIAVTSRSKSSVGKPCKNLMHEVSLVHVLGLRARCALTVPITHHHCNVPHALVCMANPSATQLALHCNVDVGWTKL